MKRCKKVKIGDFLFERAGRYKPKDKEISGLGRLEKIDFSGNFHIGEKDSKTDMIIIKKGDLVISGINVAKGAMGIYRGSEDATATIHYSSYTFNKKIINIDYFGYFLKSSNFVKLLNEQIRGGIKTEIKPKCFLPLEIELPDIEIQNEVVLKINKKLKKYKSIDGNIKNQKYILQKLRQAILQKAMNSTDKMVSLDEICDFTKGESPIQKTSPGEYPLVVTGEARKTANKFQFDEKAVCVPLVSSTGHGKKSLNYVHYQKGKFALGNILVALVPKEENILNAKFLHQYLLINKDSVLVALMKGMANVTLPIRDLKNIEIALPSIKEQNKVENLMQKLDKLEAEIAQDQKTAGRLMQAVLKEAFKK